MRAYAGIAALGAAAWVAHVAGRVRYVSRKSLIKKDIAMRNALSEQQIDAMIEDSFPASDPPSVY